MEKKLRKQQNQLVDAGTGVILFAVWSVAKVNLFLSVSSFFLDELYDYAAQYGISEKFLLGTIAVITVGILLWQLCTRIYIGINAIAEGKGQKKGWAYLVLTAFFVITDVQTQWHIFITNFIMTGDGFTPSMVVSFCLEVVSIYVLMDLLISGIRVKRLRKTMKE